MAQVRKSKIFYGYVIVLATFGIWMTAWGSSTTYGVFFKPLLTDFGWTRAMTVGARSLASGITGVMGMVTGGLTDRFGPRKVLLIFGSFLGIGYLLMTQIDNVWQYYAVYGIVIGIGFGTITIPTLTTVARWFVKRRGLMTGIVQAGSGIGGMVLSPLVAWLILTQGWRTAFFVLGIITLVSVISFGLLLKRDPSQIGLSPYGADETTRRDVNSPGTSPQTTGFSLRQAIRTRQFWMLLVMFFGFGFSRQTTLTHLVAHVTDLGFPLTVGATVLATTSGAAIIGRVGMGQLSDSIGNRRSYMIGFIVMAAALLWVITAKQLWMLYLFAAAFGFGWGTLAVIRMPALAEVFGLGSLGAILGAVDAGASTGSVIGPFLAAWLFDVTGEYTVTFLMTAAVVTVGLLMTILLRPIGGKGGEK